MSKRDPLKELAEHHGYPELTRGQKQRITIDFGKPPVSVLEDFAAYWCERVKQRRFDTYRRLRTWLRNQQQWALERARSQQGSSTSDLLARYK